MPEQTSSIYLFHQQQKTVNGSWSPSAGWGPLLDRLYDLVGAQGEIVSAYNRDGRLEVFVSVHTSSTVPINLQLWQTAPSSDTWKSGKGGAPISGNNLAVSINADGRLEVFWTDASHNIHHAWQTSPSRGPWQTARLGTQQAKALTLMPNARGCLELFYIGMDDYIYHNWQSAPNSPTWSFNKFAYQGKQIVAIENVKGPTEAVFIGLDNKLYSVSEFSPGSTQWHYGPLAGSAKFISNIAYQSDGRLTVAFVGMDNGIYLVHQTSAGAGPWQLSALGGGAQRLTFAPAAAGRLDLFYVGMDSGIYRKTQAAPNSANWLADQKLDNAYGINVCVAEQADSRLKLFYLNSVLSRPADPGPGDPGGGQVDPIPGGGDVDQPDH